MTQGTGPIHPHHGGLPSRVIQGFFPGGRPAIFQASPAPTAPVRASAPPASPVQGRPASPPAVIPPGHSANGAIQPSRRVGQAPQPILPGRPAAGAVQPSLRPGQPPQPILPGRVQPGVGPVQPAMPNPNRPQVPRPILPQQASVPPAAVQPQIVARQGQVVQRVGDGDAFQLPAHLANFGGAVGQPLPDPVRQRMESVFNTSFADVRVHVGPQAASIGALAFTHGSNLYFAPGQFNPSTAQGQQLLGHELTHVVQQRAGRVRNPFGSGVAVVQDRGMEAEADRMGQRAAAHQPSVQAKTAGSLHAAGAKRIVSSVSPQKASTGSRAIVQPYWAYRQVIGGHEQKYWIQEAGDKPEKATGWYRRDAVGNFAMFFDAEIKPDDPRVEQLPRLAAPGTVSAPLMVDSSSIAEIRGASVPGADVDWEKIDGAWSKDYVPTRARAGDEARVKTMPEQLQLKCLGDINHWAIRIDQVMDLFTRNEQDVQKWRNVLGGFSAAQIVLGIAGGAVVITGIVLTGGLAAIPLAAGAIAISLAPAAVGVAVGVGAAAASARLDQATGAASAGVAITGVKKGATGAVAVAGNQAVVRGALAAHAAVAAQGIGAGAAGVGVASSLVTGGLGARKAYKVDPGAIWKSIDWAALEREVQQAIKIVQSIRNAYSPVALQVLNGLLEKIAVVRTKRL